MKKTLILFLPLLSSVVAYAQDSLQFKKNELSINTAPVVRLLMNNSSQGPVRFSITYKRNLNPKSALRLSLMADRYESETFFGTSVMLSNDTLVEKVYTETASYYFPHINLGYERLFGKRKLKWFYGADIVVGLAKITSQTYESKSANIGFVIMNDQKGDLVASTETNVFSAGLSPFFGLKYPFSKRLSVSLQAGFDAAYKSRRTTDVKQASTNRYTSTSFDFDQSTGILNDISLVYRF